MDQTLNVCRRSTAGRDKIHAQADVYEAEIRRRKVEQRIQQERLRDHYDLDLIRPGRSYYNFDY